MWMKWDIMKIKYCSWVLIMCCVLLAGCGKQIQEPGQRTEEVSTEGSQGMGDGNGQQSADGA